MKWFLLRRLLSFICPDKCVDKVTDVSLTELSENGIRVIFVDLDNTLTAWGSSKVSEPVRQWIERAKELGFQVVIVSNAGLRKRVSPSRRRFGHRRDCSRWQAEAFRLPALLGMERLETEPSRHDWRPTFHRHLGRKKGRHESHPR
jgi:hypothetical protein